MFNSWFINVMKLTPTNDDPGYKKEVECRPRRRNHHRVDYSLQKADLGGKTITGWIINLQQADPGGKTISGWITGLKKADLEGGIINEWIISLEKADPAPRRQNHHWMDYQPEGLRNKVNRLKSETAIN